MTGPFALAVLGSPVAHSRSPVMHNAGLQALGLIGRYEAIDVDVTGLAQYAESIRDGAWYGANITMPHKGSAAELSDVLTDTASRAGAVNTWFREDGRLVGDSTDVPGVIDVMARHHMDSDSVLILGNGGAAAAAVIACEARDIWVSGRSVEPTQRFVEGLGVDVQICAWGSGVPGAALLNATPLGMHGESLEPAVIGQAAAIFDMTYGPQVSPAIAFAVSIGLPHADGIDLLAAQAERSFELWTGLTPPVGLFEEVARNVSSRSDQAPI